MHTKRTAERILFKHAGSVSIYDAIGKLNHARCKTSAIVAGMFIFANTVTFAAPQSVEIEIIDNGASVTAFAPKTTVSDVLAQQGVTLGSYDVVTPSLDTSVSDSQVIVIDRVKKVILNDGGVSKEYFTSKNTVGEFLEEKGVQIGFYDMLDTAIDRTLAENDSVEITRVVRTTLSEDEPIPFKTVTEQNYSMEIGTTAVAKEGENGVLTRKYDVYLRNGVEVSRTEVSSEVTKNPVNKVVSSGAKPQPGQAPVNYSRVVTCSATAYDLSFQSCGKRPGDPGYGITATGTRAAYGTVAVDPRVIPLGSKLYIESTDGRFVYGFATAADTGGAIKGNKVDLFFPTNSECMSFGRRSVKVYILN